LILEKKNVVVPAINVKSVKRIHSSIIVVPHPSGPIKQTMNCSSHGKTATSWQLNNIGDSPDNRSRIPPKHYILYTKKKP
jgi:hypothetical protein